VYHKQCVFGSETEQRQAEKIEQLQKSLTEAEAANDTLKKQLKDTEDYNQQLVRDNCAITTQCTEVNLLLDKVYTHCKHNSSHYCHACLNFLDSYKSLFNDKQNLSSNQKLRNTVSNMQSTFKRRRAE